MLPFFARSRAPRRVPERTQRRSCRYRPRLESLEDRTLFASVGFAVNTGAGGGGTAGTAVAVDQQGNVYTNAVVSPGQPSSGDNILVKYSSSGQLLWSMDPVLSVPASIASPLYGGIFSVGGIALDGSGNLYVGSNGTNGASVAKYDSTTGRLLWGVHLDGNPGLNALALDPVGNVYVTGNFGPSGHLNIGYSTVAQPLSASLFGLQTFSNFNEHSGYIVELQSNGQFVWGGGFLLQASNSNWFVGSGGIAADSAGNVYVAGAFAGAANFDPNGGSYIVGSSNASGDPFVLKLNAAHQLVWLDDMREVSPSGFGSEANAITADAAGNVFLLMSAWLMNPFRSGAL